MKLLDSNLKVIPGNPHILQVGIIQSGIKLYVVLLGIKGSAANKTYIEELSISGEFLFIENEKLAGELEKFANDNRLLDIKRIYDTAIDSGLCIISKEGRIQWK